jgi:hypothetical protein
MLRLLVTVSGIAVIWTASGCSSPQCREASETNPDDRVEYLMESVGIGEKMDRYECFLQLRPAPTALGRTFRPDGLVAAKEAGRRLVETNDPVIIDGMLSILEAVSEQHQSEMCLEPLVRRGLSSVAGRRNTPSDIRLAATSICPTPAAR